jgi:hypothetical protein
VKAYNRYLRDMIVAGKAKPSFVVSHEINIDEAPTAYEKFDKRIEGYTKVLIHPNGPLKSEHYLSHPYVLMRSGLRLTDLLATC